MKKVSLLVMVAMFLFIGNVKAQEDVAVLISDDFENYEVGNKVAQDGLSWWTTWSEKPGSAEDAVIVELEGNKCAHLTYGVDQVLLLGDEQSGVYDLEFDILVPSGKSGYFNILHDFNGGNSTWAMQAYLHIKDDGMSEQVYSAGHGTIHAGGNNVADVECVFDGWMHFRLHVDTDTDKAQYFYTAPGEEEVLVHEWQWSLDSFGDGVVGRKLSAMDFFPPMENSEFYLDNFSFTRIGGESTPDMVLDQESLNVSMTKDDVKSVEINIENTGSSITEYVAWVDYGVGQGGTQQEIISYAIDPVTNPALITWTDTVSSINFEIAALYPASSYGGSVMGTYITGAACLFVGYVIQGTDISTPTFEPGTDIIFRIYEQGINGNPGKVLAEKAIKPEDVSWEGEYTFVTFDEPVPLTGFDVYLGVEMTGAPGCTLMNLDGNKDQAVVGYGDLLRQNNGRFTPVSDDGVDGDSGNWCLFMLCEGAPISGSWAELDKSYGVMPIGESDKVTVNLNSMGLEAAKDYKANVRFSTNIPEKEIIDVPLTLHVYGENVEEILSNTYNIYPNPTSGLVTIEAENIDYIAVYNSVGQLVNIVKNENNTVDMSSYDNGVYYFNIVDNAGQKSVQRIVVAK